MDVIGFIVTIIVLMMLAAPFVLSGAAICYNLSHYSTLSAKAQLPLWEMRALHILIYYPIVSFVFLVLLYFIVPEQITYMVNTYCITHALLSTLGAAGAWYLRRRNKGYTRYFLLNLLSGCIYFAIFFSSIFNHNSVL